MWYPNSHGFAPGVRDARPPTTEDMSTLYLGTDQIALANHRHERDGAVGGIVGGVHPDPARFARLEHGPVRGRVIGRGGGKPRAVEVGPFERPLRRRDAAVLDEALHLVTEVGCDDVHLGARRDQRLDLAGRNPSAAHDHAAPSGDEQVDRVPAERSAAMTLASSGSFW